MSVKKNIDVALIIAFVVLTAGFVALARDKLIVRIQDDTELKDKDNNNNRDKDKDNNNNRDKDKDNNNNRDKDKVKDKDTDPTGEDPDNPEPPPTVEEPVITLGYPSRLAITPEGTLLVSDPGNRQVLEMKTGDMSIVRRIPVSGKPLGVAITNNQIFIGNSSSSRVQVFDRNGLLLKTMGGVNNVIGLPGDMAADGNELFVLDSASGVVRVFDVSRNPEEEVRTIPSGGPSMTLLAKPTAVAVDPVRKEVLVSDYGTGGYFGAPRIQIFNYEGNKVATISGKKGMMGRRFSRPQGLAVNAEGHVLMVECLLGRVFVFDRTTGQEINFHGTYDAEGLQPGGLLLPMDVVINSSTGDIFVTNKKHKRIEVFVAGGQVQ